MVRDVGKGTARGFSPHGDQVCRAMNGEETDAIEPRLDQDVWRITGPA